jgi:WD40-like Beta Propeller Repeat
MRGVARGRGVVLGAWPRSRSLLLPSPVVRLLSLSLLLAPLGCALKKPAEKHYYDQHVQPILTSFCVGNTSPCHRVDPTTGGALGNLDLSSFDAVHKRPDVLRTYGSYPLPLLLMKVLPKESVTIPYEGQALPLLSEIEHAGGKSLSANSDAFYVLKRWLDNGANLDAIAPEPHPNMGSGPCNNAVPADRDLSVVDTSSPAYALFLTDVAPTLAVSCTYSTCHSSPQSDFYLTCGSDDTQMRFNYLQAAGFVAALPIAPEQSEILLRPLAPAAGGVSHTGGIFFNTRDDDTWKSWKAWAMAVQADPLPAPVKSAGQQFFEANVMPKLLQRGCALEGCHSPDGFNDFRLRPGAQGFIAPRALQRNYEALVNEFMSLDTADVLQSRAVKKTIFPSSGGTGHRAGPVLESPNFTIGVAACPTPYDFATANAFCTFAELHRIERADRAATVSVMAAGTKLPLAFVVRPPDPDSLLQFDTFRGGADLMIADAMLGASGAVTGVANAHSVLGACTGLVAGTADVRGPEWSADGQQLVFAGRPSDAGGLDLWVIDFAAGGACRQLTTDNGRAAGPVKVHNFDPTFAPDGSVVFASTRAGTLTPKLFLPNADLFRSKPGADFSAVEQMTWLLGSEIGPAFMQDGRVSFTAEKASPEFYQLSGRRINWDLTDYHPLLAQRAQSTDTFDMTLHPSVGYSQATEIREGLDRNFLIILSDVGAVGAGGALATFNRSVGPFEEDRPEASFLKSVRIVDAAATARPGTVGVYRSPSSLPNGEILASYAGNIQDPTTGTPKYDLVAVDQRVPTSGARRVLFSDASRSAVEAVLGAKRSSTALFHNLPQLVFGGHVDSGGDTAIMHFPDLPMLATLLGANLRHGRNVAEFDAASALRVYEEHAPPSANPGGLQGSQNVYVDRSVVGTASFESDHSLKVTVPAHKPLVLELVDGNGKAVFTMSEEHQVTAGEYVTPGVPRALFNGICAGCHGSITGNEIDVAVTPDALTGASVSRSRDQDPKALQ